MNFLVFIYFNIVLSYNQNLGSVDVKQSIIIVVYKFKKYKEYFIGMYIEIFRFLFKQGLYLNENLKIFIYMFIKYFLYFLDLYIVMIMFYLILVLFKF